jgi:hypothetical protein
MMLRLLTFPQDEILYVIAQIIARNQESWCSSNALN